MALRFPIHLELSVEGKLHLVDEARNQRIEIDPGDLTILSRLTKRSNSDCYPESGGQDGISWGTEAQIRQLMKRLEFVDGSEQADSPRAERSRFPVFIIGSLRSGSTLLRYLLDSHEHLACPPESKFIAALQEFLDYPQVGPALASLGLALEDIHREIRIFINRVLGGYAARVQKPRWVDKTPNYYRAIPFIEEVFCQEVLYVFVIRHPLDCIASLETYFRPSARHEDPDIARAVSIYGKGRYGWAKYWIDVYERIYVFSSSHPERSHILKYEDLVQKTETTVRDVVQFLGETDSTTLLKNAFTSLHSGGYQDMNILRTKGVHANSVDRWKTWQESEITALWDLVSELASKFGYALPVIQRLRTKCSNTVGG